MYKNSRRDEVYNRSMSFFLPIFFNILGLPFTYISGHHRHNIIHIISFRKYRSSKNVFNNSKKSIFDSPFSVNIVVIIGFFKNSCFIISALCDIFPPLTILLSHSLPFSLYLSVPFSLSLSLCISLSLSLSISVILSLCHSLSLFLCPFLSLCHSLSLSLFLSLLNRLCLLLS